MLGIAAGPFPTGGDKNKKKNVKMSLLERLNQANAGVNTCLCASKLKSSVRRLRLCI